MDVVGHAADAQDRALEFVAFAAEALVDFGANRAVVEEGVAVFGREDEVEVDLGD
jgi:hypothetical protein